MVVKRCQGLAPSSVAALSWSSRHADQAGQQDQEHQRRPLPDIGDHDGKQRQRRIGEPGDGDGVAGQRRQDVVHRSARLEQHEEHVAGDGGHHHHRHQQDGIEDALARKFVGEQGGERQAEQEFGRHADRHDDRRAPKRAPEARIRRQVGVVGEGVPELPGIPPAGARQRRPVGQADVELHQQRKHRDEQHQQLRRQRQAKAETRSLGAGRVVLCLLVADGHGAPLLHRRCRRAHCFSAPKVRPRTRCRWMAMPMMTGGTAAMRPSAALAP